MLHHTAGGSAASSVAWWNQTRDRIGTAYIIERDGTVYETFDPEYWAYHLGIGGAIEKRSIGIELANWGPLQRVGPRYLNWANREVGPDGADGTSAVVAHDWRGEHYWEAYPEAQLDAAFALTRQLVDRFGIDPDVAPAQLGSPDTARFRRFRGIVGHHHVRSDKTDVHPGFPWDRLTSAIEGTTAPAHPARPDTDSLYIVSAGDTLWSIAQRLGTTVSALKVANRLHDDDIAVGQRLRVA